MKRILIVGATGTVGSQVRKTLLENTDYQLTLFSRTAAKLNINPLREKAISGDVNSLSDLKQAIKQQDAVFVSLSGNLPLYIRNIITVMKQEAIKRLIFISSMGIYDEIPASVGANGNLKFNPMLEPYRQAADLVEQSDLTYTIIRPGWFTQGPINYVLTEKGEPFGGHDISVASIADLVRRLLEDENFGINESFGINTPNS